MNSFELVALILLIFSVIFTVLFGATFVHILRGSKLANVAIMAGLILAANIFFAASIIPNVIYFRAD